MESMLQTAHKWIWDYFGDKQKRQSKNASMAKSVDNLIFDISFLQYFPLSIHLANLYDIHAEANDGSAEVVL